MAEMTEALANYFRYNISRKETFVYLKDELKKYLVTTSKSASTDSGTVFLLKSSITG